MTHSTEHLVNQALSGIAFYHRDTNLTNRLVQQYRIGHIVQHQERLLVADQFGGLTSDTRYVIASAHAAIEEKSPIAIEAGAFFKVLDIMVINQKTQILLLHLPAESVKIFTTQHIPFEVKLLETHRQIFIEHTYQTPVAALQTQTWRTETAAPIGMDNEGKLYYDFDPPKPTAIASQKVNRYKDGADPKQPRKKTFWQRLFGGK